MKGFNGHKMKRILSFLLSVALTFSAFSGLNISVSAVTYITSSTDVRGSKYANAEKLPEALNKIFAGDIDIYSDNAFQKEVSMPLGYQMNNSTTFYVKNKTTKTTLSGKQCYVYANAVYNRLFNEYVYHGESFDHSKVVVKGGTQTLSYNTLYKAGVRTGAYMRTTDTSDGKYSNTGGHSMIILSYDKNGINYLEGNGDGKGLVRIAERTWDEFNSSQLSGKKRYLAHIVQPLDAYYDSVFKPYVMPSLKASVEKLDLALNSVNKASFTVTCAGTYTSVGCTASPKMYAITSKSKSGRTYTINIESTAYGEDEFVFYLKDTDGIKRVTLTIKVSVSENNEIYNISYNANGGTNTPEAQIKKHNIPLYVTEAKPTGKSYTVTFDPNKGSLKTKTKKYTNQFASWNTLENGNGDSFSSGGEFADNADTTLYAVWENSAFGKPQEPTRLAYNFLGWYTSKELNEDKTPKGQLYSEETPVDKNVTLYAMWEINKEQYYDPDYWWQYNKGKEVPLKSATSHYKGVYVTWNELKGARKYIVYRRTAKTGWERLAVLDGAKRSYIDSTAKSGTKYIYTVKAQNGKEYSKYNKTGKTVNYIASPKVTLSNATAGVTVKWNKISGASKYYIYRKTTGGWTRLGVITGTSFTDKTAKSGVTYTYTVKAGKNGIVSYGSQHKKIARLSTPSLSALKASSGKTTLTFKKVSGAEKYIVYRKTGNGSWAVVATTKSTTYVDRTVKKGTYYTYTVRAVKGSDRSYYVTKGLKIRAK